MSWAASSQGYKLQACAGFGTLDWHDTGLETNAVEVNDGKTVTLDKTPPELAALRQAIRIMRCYDTYHQYDQRSFRFWADIHANNCQHGWEQFLSWHRLYLYYFEQQLQDLLRRIMLMSSMAESMIAGAVRCLVERNEFHAKEVYEKNKGKKVEERHASESAKGARGLEDCPAEFDRILPARPGAQQDSQQLGIGERRRS